MTADVRDLIDQYVAAIEAAIVTHYAKAGYQADPPVVSIERGRAYTRVVLTHPMNGGGGSVHAFVVNATGEVVKAASWASPQKGKAGLAVRYRLADAEDRARCFAAIDPYGSYLYAH